MIVFGAKFLYTQMESFSRGLGSELAQIARLFILSPLLAGQYNADLRPPLLQDKHLYRGLIKSREFENNTLVVLISIIQGTHSAGVSGHAKSSNNV
jgi:hypothetical protein